MAPGDNLRYDFITPMDEQRVIQTIKAVMPAVVSISISKRIGDVRKDIAKEMAALKKAKQIPAKEKADFPDSMADARGMVQVGGGSGFVVEAGGLILTNKHVVNEPDAEYLVATADGRTFAAEILSRDPINDVALLRVKAENLPALAMGDASRLELGQGVIAIGNALGLFQNSVSLGIVSGLSRSIIAQAEPDASPQEMRGLIQTDAAINPGNSGGPLVSLSGEVIGINTVIIQGAQSIGFAIPVNAAERDLQDIKKYGRIRRPAIGIRYLIIDEALQKKMNLPVGYGALIAKEAAHDYGIVPGSPADEAGLAEGDIVLELNGEKVTRTRPVQDILENLPVGAAIAAKFMRNGKTFTAEVKLAERK